MPTLSSRALILVTGLLSTTIALIGGAFLYSNGKSLIESTVEELSVSDCEYVAAELRDSHTRAEQHAKEFEHLISYWDGLPSTRETFGDWVKHKAFSDTTYTSGSLGAGVVGIPRHNPYENDTMYYDIVWTDTLQTGQTEYVHGHYEPSQWNDSRCRRMTDLPSGEVNKRCVIAAVLDPHGQVERANAYFYVDKLLPLFVREWEGETEGRSFWRGLSIWYSRDSTPQPFLAHHLLVPEALNPPHMKDLQIVIATYVLVSEWETLLRDFATRATMVVATMSNGVDSKVLSANAEGVTLITEGCKRDDASEDYHPCVRTFDSVPRWIRDAALVLNASTPQAFLRREIAGRSTWLRRVELFTLHRAGGRTERVDLLWMRAVASVEGELNQALLYFLAFVGTVFAVDVLLVLLEVFVLVRPLAKLSRAMGPLRRLQLDEVEELLDVPSATVIEVAELIQGFRFALEALKEFKTYLPGLLFDNASHTDSPVESCRGDNPSEPPVSTRHLLSSAEGHLVPSTDTDDEGEGRCVPFRVREGTVALVVVEISGSPEESTAVVRSTLAKHRGHELVKRSGEGGNSFAAVFADPHTAVEFALAMQTESEGVHKTRQAVVAGDPNSGGSFASRLIYRAARLAEMLDDGTVAADAHTVKNMGNSSAKVIPLGPSPTGDFVCALVHPSLEGVAAAAFKPQGGAAQGVKAGLSKMASLVVHVKVQWSIDGLSQEMVDSFFSVVHATSRRTDVTLISAHGENVTLTCKPGKLNCASRFASLLYRGIQLARREEVHVGMAQGALYVGGVGSASQRFIAAIGEPVSIAAAVASAAAEHGVYVGVTEDVAQEPLARPYTRTLGRAKHGERGIPVYEFHVLAQQSPEGYGMGPLEWNEGRWGEAAPHELGSVRMAWKDDSEPQGRHPARPPPPPPEPSAGGDPLCVALFKGSLPVDTLGGTVLTDLPTGLTGLVFPSAASALSLTIQMLREGHDGVIALHLEKRSGNPLVAYRARAVDTALDMLRSAAGSGVLSTEETVAACGRMDTLDGVERSWMGKLCLSDGDMAHIVALHFEGRSPKAVGGNWHKPRAPPSSPSHAKAGNLGPRTSQFGRAAVLAPTLLACQAVLLVDGITSGHWVRSYITLAGLVPTIVLFLALAWRGEDTMTVWSCVWLCWLGMVYGVVYDASTKGAYSAWLALLLVAHALLALQSPWMPAFRGLTLVFLASKALADVSGFRLHEILPSDNAYPTPSTGVREGLGVGLLRCAAFACSTMHSKALADQLAEHRRRIAAADALLMEVVGHLFSFDLPAIAKCIEAHRTALDTTLADRFAAVAQALQPFVAYLPQTVTMPSPSQPGEHSLEISSRSTNVDTTLSPAKYEGPAMRQVTLAAFNICGFLDFVDSVTVPDLTRFHEMYLLFLLHEIRVSSGMVDTFSGDRVCASFNAGTRCTMHRLRGATCAMAVRSKSLHSAEDMMRAVVTSVPATRLTVGVASGRALCGDLGCAAMRKYAILGEVASFVHCVERCASSWGVPAVCDDKVQSEGQGHFLFRALELVLPKRSSAPVVLWEIVKAAGPVAEEWMYELEQSPWKVYNEAVLCMFNGEYDRALSLLDGSIEDEVVSRAASTLQCRLAEARQEYQGRGLPPVPLCLPVCRST